ncbi:MAG: CPBP family intramembrane metalloprotease [Streptosporangiales bacterium]|nr:CPBP family intramembrane metalloprotease [Streptosporangiales bacterium]
MLAVVIAVLVAANLVNNWFAARAYLLTCVLASGVLLALARAAGLSWTDLGLGVDHLGGGLRWGAVAAAAVVAGYAAAAALPPTRRLLLDRRVADLNARDVLYRALVRVPLGTVLLEEIAFRGVLYGMVRREHGWIAGTAFSSLLFGLWHVLSSRALSARARRVPVALGAVAATAIAGAVLCELVRRSGSLLAPAGLHLATNSIGYVAAFAALRAAARSNRGSG